MDMRAIHETAAPVHAYVKHISELTGGSFSVVTVPPDSAAYNMGYRFVSIPDDELPHYLAHGATLA
jgi:hypothetical protein